MKAWGLPWDPVHVIDRLPWKLPMIQSERHQLPFIFDNQLLELENWHVCSRFPSFPVQIRGKIYYQYHSRMAMEAAVEEIYKFRYLLLLIHGELCLAFFAIYLRKTGCFFFKLVYICSGKPLFAEFTEGF